jgi:hypothetical protein
MIDSGVPMSVSDDNKLKLYVTAPRSGHKQRQANKKGKHANDIPASQPNENDIPHQYN